jgi:hypothetical protein
MRKRRLEKHGRRENFVILNDLRRIVPEQLLTKPGRANALDRWLRALMNHGKPPEQLVVEILKGRCENLMIVRS